jgi:hypothetical protein
LFIFDKGNNSFKLENNYKSIDWQTNVCLIKLIWGR